MKLQIAVSDSASAGELMRLLLEEFDKEDIRFDAERWEISIESGEANRSLVRAIEIVEEWGHEGRAAEAHIRLTTVERENAQLRTALTTRVVIEQAKGILAERLQIGLDEAFALLRRAARSNRRRLHDLAADVVDRRETPVEIRQLLQR